MDMFKFHINDFVTSLDISIFIRNLLFKSGLNGKPLSRGSIKKYIDITYLGIKNTKQIADRLFRF
jgi:hypothetical protein